MQGRRVDQKESDSCWPWPAMQPGDYGKGLDGLWMCRAPKESKDNFGFMGNLSKHQVIEHADGTITVQPSILIRRHDGEWHGFLQQGVWREC